MIEITADIWEEAAKRNAYVVVPTNGYVKKNGCAVMGRGLAKQASDKHPALAGALGRRITRFGNVVQLFPDIKVIAFPVKHHWSETADVNLINESARKLSVLAVGITNTILIPRVGCGNGRLPWFTVKPVLEKWLNHLRHIVICDTVS